MAAPARTAAVKSDVGAMQRRLSRVCCVVKEGQEREVAWLMGLARAVVVLYSMLDVMAETQRSEANEPR